MLQLKNMDKDNIYFMEHLKLYTFGLKSEAESRHSDVEIKMFIFT